MFEALFSALKMQCYHGHIEGNNTYWGLSEGGGWKEGVEQEKKIDGY